MHNRTEQKIMINWNKDLDQPVVSVCCTTYNHEDYIAEAIDGFLMQETDFPFEILIRDDCSTDKTTEIVKEYADKYPSLIKPVFEKENTYSQGVKPMSQLYKVAMGRYIALCEGDDYWTDSLKLQKQVDFLEGNKEYVMCGSQYINSLEKKTLCKKLGTITFKDNIIGNKFGTLTVMFRKKYINKKLLEYLQPMPIGDWPLWMALLIYGDGYILSDVTAVYRIHTGGVHSQLDWVTGRSMDIAVYNKLSDSDSFSKKELSLINQARKIALFELIVQKRRDFKDELKMMINEKVKGLNIIEKYMLISSLYLPNKLSTLICIMVLRR